MLHALQNIRRKMCAFMKGECMSSVHLSVLDIQFDIFQFLGKRAKVVTATVKIFICLHDE